MAEVDLNDVAVFVRVVDLGAFAKAARELHVPTSTVSRAVARLEERVGATLLQRSTRNVQPTAEGRAFYAQVGPAVSAVRAAARGVEPPEGTPRGLLRVTAPNDLGESVLAEIVAAFVDRYPRVEVELLLTPRIVNLVEEGVDAAVRAGPLPDSSLVARKLASMRAGLYASPAYLARHGTPETLAALEEHACVLFRARGPETTWALVGSEGEVQVRVRGRVLADDFLFVRAATVAGAGVALLPEVMTAGDVESGLLVPVLPGYATAGAPLHLVHAPAKVLPVKLRAFRDFVVAAFDRRGGGESSGARGRGREKEAEMAGETETERGSKGGQQDEEKG